MFRHHPFLSVVTFAYLGVVAFLTLGPQPIDEGSNALIWRLLGFLSRHEATSWVTYSFLEFWSNVAMFVPVGLFFLLLLGRRRWWLAILLGVLLTCGIEFAQQFIPSRVSDPRDILANSVGASAGVLIALIVTWPAAIRRSRERRRLAPAA
ncbi:MAG: VanZ family protein [Microbacteriaceae bacterium]|nr:VanZ family protein [Microbacteriaceae bacterium]